MGLLLFLAAFRMWAADDANEILRRMLEADRGNAIRASQFVYVEQVEHISIDKNGARRKDNSETFEVVFVEGAKYKKLLARNDRPLASKEQARERSKMEHVAEERRKARRSGLLHPTVSLGTYEDLLTLFDNRLRGEEEIRGRRAWVISSTPQQGHAAANEHEREVLSFEKKLWIDETELQVVRSLSTVAGKHIFMTPGSTIQWDFGRVNGDTWMLVSGVLDGRLQFAKMIRPAVRTEYTYSQFRKFDVQSTITLDPPKN